MGNQVIDVNPLVRFWKWNFVINSYTGQCWIRGCLIGIDQHQASSINRYWSVLRSFARYWSSLIFIEIHFGSMPQIWSGIDQHWSLIQHVLIFSAVCASLGGCHTDPCSSSFHCLQCAHGNLWQSETGCITRTGHRPQVPGQRAGYLLSQSGTLTQRSLCSIKMVGVKSTYLINLQFIQHVSIKSAINMMDLFQNHIITTHLNG